MYLPQVWIVVRWKVLFLLLPEPRNAVGPGQCEACSFFANVLASVYALRIGRVFQYLRRLIMMLTGNSFEQRASSKALQNRACSMIGLPCRPFCYVQCHEVAALTICDLRLYSSSLGNCFPDLIHQINVLESACHTSTSQT